MWNRGYIPKLRSGDLPSLPAEQLATGLNPGSSLRILSLDANDGACTCLWRIPAGWRHPTPFTLRDGEALFVLEGDLTIGTQQYTQGCYCYRPGGYVHEPMSSEGGATILCMWDGAPMLQAATLESSGSDEPVLRIDTLNIEGVPTFVEGPLPGITVKLLRSVSETGGMTLLVNIPPGWAEPRFEHHDCVEESFKTAGSMHMLENGIAQQLTAGDYFFRPPYVNHGPMHSDTGTTSLIRFSAKLVNHYSPAETSDNP